MTASGLVHKAIAERYELIGEVGQGGMATVYLGRDLVLGREVAVKILHSHLAKDVEHRRRFRREARTTARLQHPNIVKIFDFAEQESQSADGQGNDSPVYLVMEFIKGQTLQELLEEQEFPLSELAVALIEQVAEALEHAHQQQIIHRDLKPENVLIQEDGAVKLTDFGLARILDGESMTRTGTILGSPAYMAPEQIEGRTGDHRTDLFSLGVMLYRLACQKHPFDLSNPMAILKAVGSGAFSDPESVRPGIGRELARIIKRAMALDPNQRYTTVGEMRAALSEYLEEAGIEEPAETLKDYLLHRDVAIPKIQARVVLFLKASARRLARQKRFAAALDRCNRVLSLDPDDHDTHALIRRLSQQERWGQLSIWAAAAAMLICLSIGGWYLIQNNRIASNETPDSGAHTNLHKALTRRTKAPLPRQYIPRAPAPRPRSRFIARRTKCRIAIPRGRGRYYDLLDFNLGFQLALRGSKRRPLLAIRLRPRREEDAGLRLYNGPIYAVIDGASRARLSLTRTSRISLKSGVEHQITFLFPKIKQRRQCEAYIPLERPSQPRRTKPIARNVDPDVQKEPPPAGPPRSFLIRINTHYADVLIENDFEKRPIRAKIYGRSRKFSLISNRTWTMTLKKKSAKESKWRLLVPLGSEPLKAQRLDANGNAVRWKYLEFRASRQMPELFVQMIPKTAFIKIGCNVPEAALVIGGGSLKGLDEAAQLFPLRWGWNRWAEATKSRAANSGVLLRISAVGHNVWEKRVKIEPGQTVNLGVIKLQRNISKIPKRRPK